MAERVGREGMFERRRGKGDGERWTLWRELGGGGGGGQSEGVEIEGWGERERERE